MLNSNKFKKATAATSAFCKKQYQAAISFCKNNYADILVFIFFLIAVIFMLHCRHQIDKSFDNCDRLIVEINQNLEILGNELQTLQQTMGVDYE